MAELQDLAGTDIDSFPGHTLSPLTLPDLALAERQSANQYIQRMEEAVSLFSPEVAEVYRVRAADNVKNTFTIGYPNFDSWAKSSAGLFFLAWLSFRKTEPKMTFGQATEICSKMGWSNRSAILSMAGYNFPKPVAAPVQNNPQAGQSPIDSASQPQSDAATPTIK